jgi:hypothetical protein
MQIYLLDIMFPVRYYSPTVRVNQIFHQVELFQEWENVLDLFFSNAIDYQCKYIE